MGAVRSVDFSQDSRHLITGSDDKTAKVRTKYDIEYKINQSNAFIIRYGHYLAVSSFVHWLVIVTGSELLVLVPLHPLQSQAVTTNK